MGLELLKNLKEVREQRDFYKQLLYLEQIEKQNCKTKFEQFKRGLKEYYPNDREYLKKNSGKTLELNGVYIQKEDRGILVRYIKDGDNRVTDHLWLKVKTNEGFSKGDRVKIKGTVTKYASMSYQKPLRENYGLSDVVIEKLT
jgi:hypothetical protein